MCLRARGFSNLCINNGDNFLLPVELQVSKTVTRSLDCFIPDTGPSEIVQLGFIFQNKPVSSQLKIFSEANLLMFDEVFLASHLGFRVEHLMLHRAYYI